MSAVDDALIDRLQRAAFDYLVEQADSLSGLVGDTSRKDSPSSIAVVGFALSAHAVAAERGWLTRQDAAARTLRTLRFLESSEQSTAADATGYKGFYYHFLDRRSGKRVWHCELSPIDTSLLIAGVLCADAYFSDDVAAEAEIRTLSRILYDRVDWDWARNSLKTVAQGWKPDSGFLHYGWDGYNEAAILYVLGLGSSTHPLPPTSYAAWTATYQWEQLYGRELLYAGPLFIHQFSHAWIDFRNIRDAFMREKRSDYFQNSCRAIEVQREYARRNPNGYSSYSADCWGLSAGDGPGFRTVHAGGSARAFFGYTARGVPYGPDDGTIAPAAALASMPFAPAEALAAVRRFLALYPEWADTLRLPGGFNRTLAGGWVCDACFGLDQGIAVLMIENYRSGLPWKLMRSCRAIRTGLERAGFEGGWL